MFSRFLKVADRCPVCGEELFHQRADDFPAYLVIVLVGHTVVPLALLVETEFAPALWLQVALWVPLTGAAVTRIAFADQGRGRRHAMVRRHARLCPRLREAARGVARGRALGFEARMSDSEDPGPHLRAVA